jgi:hypothetical protein
MTYFAHKPSPPSTGPAAAWLVGLIALIAVPSSALGQSGGYAPAEASGLLDYVSVFVAGERVNQTDADEPPTNVGPVGVQRCRELSRNASDRQVTFDYYYDTSASVEIIGGDERFLIDLPYSQATDIACNPDRSGTDRDVTDCDQITQDAQRIIFGNLNGGISVTMTWDALRTERDSDNSDEECVFPSDPDRPDSNGMNGDAGMGDTGMGDAGDVGMDAEAGMEPDGTDMGADAYEIDPNGYSAPDVPEPKSDDHLYISRLFLTNTGEGTDSNRAADGAIRLDRTRPSGPQNAQAIATENVIRVRFDTPANREEIETYHVFYSNQPIPSFDQKSPEQLIEEGRVNRELLIGEADDRSGTLEDEISGLDLDGGQRVYVAVASRDKARNYSPLAIIRPGFGNEVRNSIDWWGRYNAAGGPEEGGFGCRSVGHSPVTPTLLVIFLAGLGCLRRRT